MKIKFVQPGSLNRHVDSSIPLTWAKRWDAYRPTIPLILFCCVVYLPTIAVVSLLERSWDPIFRAMLGFALFPPFMLAVFEVKLRMRQRARRVLQLGDKKLKYGHDNFAASGRWEDIQVVRFYPIKEAAEFHVATFEFKSQKGRRPRIWQVVLPATEVQSVLLHELKARANMAQFQIRFEESCFEEPGRRKVPMLWFYALGMILVVHGMPLIAAGFAGGTQRGKDEVRSESKIKLSKEANERLLRLFVEYVGTMVRLRTLLVLTGGILTTAGIISFRHQIRILRESFSAEPNQLDVQARSC